MSENSIEMNAAQRDANQALLEKFEAVDERIQEEKKLNRLELDEEL